VTTVRYANRAISDLERLTDFLRETDPEASAETADLIVSAVEMLARHPLLGRLTASGYRELVVSRGSTGYLALYRYDADNDRVLVLAIRHQREAGYR
jgi:addiction module RelE/StbE family toxin